MMLIHQQKIGPSFAFLDDKILINPSFNLRANKEKTFVRSRRVPMKTGTMSDLLNHGAYDNSDGTIGKFRQNW